MACTHVSIFECLGFDLSFISKVWVTTTGKWMRAAQKGLKMSFLLPPAPQLN